MAKHRNIIFAEEYIANFGVEEAQKLADEIYVILDQRIWRSRYDK